MTIELLTEKIAKVHVDCASMGELALRDVMNSKLTNKKEIGIEILYFLKMLGESHDVQRYPAQVVASGNSLVEASKNKKSPKSFKLFASDIKRLFLLHPLFRRKNDRLKSLLKTVPFIHCYVFLGHRENLYSKIPAFRGLKHWYLTLGLRPRFDNPQVGENIYANYLLIRWRFLPKFNWEPIADISKKWTGRSKEISKVYWPLEITFYTNIDHEALR